MLRTLEFIITIGVVIIAISCLSIDAKLRENSKRDKDHFFTQRNESEKIKTLI